MIVWLMLEIINDNALMSDSIFILYIVLGLTNYHPSMRRDGRWLKTRSRKSPVTAICSLLLIGQRHSVVLLASYWLWCHRAIPWQKIGIPDRHRCRRHKWTSNWNGFAKNSVNTQHTVLEWYGPHKAMSRFGHCLKPAKEVCWSWQKITELPLEQL